MPKHSFHHGHHHDNDHENRSEIHKGPGDTEDRGAESGGAVLGADTEGSPAAAEKAEGPGKDAPENGSGAEKRIADLEAQLAASQERNTEMEAQLANLEDQRLRKAAEFENFRKRMNREKLEAIEFANQSLLLDLIPILDDFDRALQSAESSQDFAALYEGVGMIAKRLAGMLDNKWGLKSYVSAGTPFDPNFHEALMMEKSSAVAEQMVQIDLFKGYTLKSRVIRSNKVKVLDPDPAAPAIEAPPPPRKEGDPAEAEGEASPAGEGA
jgi:molecular chaperone GrpE